MYWKLNSVWLWVVAAGLSAALTVLASWGLQYGTAGWMNTAAGPVAEVEGAQHYQDRGGLRPGSRVFTGDLTCSVGWPATVGGRAGFLTARHCFEGQDVRDAQITVPVESGDLGVPVQLRLSGSAGDLAFVATGDFPVPAATSLAGYTVSAEPATAEWLMRERPVICRAGQSTGLACGQLRAVVAGKVYFTSNGQSGDSGGPVFAISGDRAVPLGVMNATRSDEAHIAIAQLLEPYVDDWGITLNVG